VPPAAPPAFVGPLATPAISQGPAGAPAPHLDALVTDRAYGGSHAITTAAAPAPAAAKKKAKAARVTRPGVLVQPDSVGVLPGSDVLPVVHTIVQRSVSHPEAPLSLALIVGLFLLIQHRIDRRDPKLAGAPRVEPPDLEFGGAIRYA
jgi:hypothetical protein